MDKPINLNEGGLAVVLIGNNGFVPEFSKNPSVMFIDTAATAGELLSAVVPDNTRAVIYTEGVPTYHYNWIISFCRRKQIPYLHRKTNDAVYQTLKGFFPTNGGEAPKVTLADVKETEKRGKLQLLLPFIDWNKSTSENAVVLLRKAVELNIKTTEGSVKQYIISNRNKLRIGTVPKSARPKLDVSVEMLDEAIKSLGDMREFLIETVEENRMLKTKLEKYRKALESIE